MRVRFLGKLVMLILVSVVSFFVISSAFAANPQHYQGYIKEVQSDSGYLIGATHRFYLYDKAGTFIGYLGSCADGSGCEYSKYNSMLYAAFSGNARVEIVASGIYKGYFVDVSQVIVRTDNSYLSGITDTTKQILAIVKQIYIRVLKIK